MSLYKHIRLLILLAGLVAFSSCGSSKDVVYFQDIKPGVSEIKLPELKAITVRPEDKISIIVNSRDPQLTDLFNLPYVSRQLGQSSSLGRNSWSTSQGISVYTVDADGKGLVFKNGSRGVAVATACPARGQPLG